MTERLSLGENVNRLLGRLTHPSLRAEPDIFYRARVLIGLLLSINALLFAICIGIIVGGMSVEARSIGLSLCGGLVVGNFLLLYIARFHGRYTLSSTLAISLSTLVIVLGIVFSGGIRQSPASQLLMVPPLMSFFFCGIRIGLWSVLLMLTLVLIFFTMEQMGVVFLLDISAADLDQSRMQTSLLCIALVSMLALIFETTASRLKQERNLEHHKALALAQTDALTGLANRLSFDTQLAARIDSASPDVGFTLCYLDLDGFKPINDRHGHGVGDEVLRVIATRLTQVVRGNDVVGRHGGDEFTLIFDALTDRDALQHLAERTLASIREPIETSIGVLSVGVSIGLACYPQHGTSAKALRKAADQAMYAAKQQRNQWRLYEGAAIISAAGSAGQGTFS